MSHPPGCPVVRFDHHSTDFAGDPWSIYGDLRAARVAYSETYGGCYVLSRYEDVRAAARDDETFSSDREVVLPPTGVGRLIPLNADPPDLQRYRSALYPYFTLRAAEAMEADIRRFTTTTIDAFIEAGRCDLITHLLGLEAAGTLNRNEVVDLLMMVTIGGFDTTMAAIGSALLFLDHHPDERRRLAADPDLLPAAVDEFLRFEAPVQGFARTVTRDIEIDGCPVAAGETVFLLWGSANRDPEAFDHPDEMILDRQPNRHLTFGVGGHRCLGAHVTRVEMRVVLSETLRRLGDYSVTHDEVLWPRSVGILYGRAHIPATFTPTAPLS